MNQIFDWFVLNWRMFVVPLAVTFSILVIFLWLRGQMMAAVERWAVAREDRKMLRDAVRLFSLHFSVIISVFLGLMIADLGERWKTLANSFLLSLLLISATVIGFRLAERFITLQANRLKAPSAGIKTMQAILRIAFLIFIVLGVMDIWRISTSPLLLLIGVAVLASALALRNMIPNWFGWVQMAAASQIKIGDYIKLPGGEEGQVTDISLAYTSIKAMDESIILIPNRKLTDTTIINYGRPLKQARDFFQFYTCLHLTELTGLKARNLKELAEMIRTASEASMHHHTHHYIQEHHYLRPEPANDFAVWVTDALGDEVLGERLASVDPFQFPVTSALRERFASVIEERLAEPVAQREASEGREFYFMRVLRLIMPTPIVVKDLRQFIEGIHRVSSSSIYFHMFEARVRLGTGQNDFSLWLQKSLGEPELAEKVARLDPYTYSLEGLKLALIKILEKPLK